MVFTARQVCRRSLFDSDHRQVLSANLTGRKQDSLRERSIMFAWSWKSGLAGAVVMAATAYAFAEMPGHQGHGAAGHTMSPGSDAAGMDGCPMMKGGGVHGKHAMMHGQDAASAGPPSLPGQDAFGAIQEVVRLLEADPATNWPKGAIRALREDHPHTN